MPWSLVHAVHCQDDADDWSGNGWVRCSFAGGCANLSTLRQIRAETSVAPWRVMHVRGGARSRPRALLPSRAIASTGLLALSRSRRAALSTSAGWDLGHRYSLHSRAELWSVPFIQHRQPVLRPGSVFAAVYLICFLPCPFRPLSVPLPLPQAHPLSSSLPRPPSSTPLWPPPPFCCPRAALAQRPAVWRRRVPRLRFAPPSPPAFLRPHALCGRRRRRS